MNRIAEDILMHYGVKRRSGRYPWGSGDTISAIRFLYFVVCKIFVYHFLKRLLKVFE